MVFAEVEAIDGHHNQRCSKAEQRGALLHFADPMVRELGKMDCAARPPVPVLTRKAAQKEQGVCLAVLLFASGAVFTTRTEAP